MYTYASLFSDNSKDALGLHPLQQLDHSSKSLPVTQASCLWFTSSFYSLKIPSHWLLTLWPVLPGTILDYSCCPGKIINFPFHCQDCPSSRDGHTPLHLSPKTLTSLSRLSSYQLLHLNCSRFTSCCKFFLIAMYLQLFPLSATSFLSPTWICSAFCGYLEQNSSW